MAKGGARARSGPPPDPNALRRDRDDGDWITLPTEGRKGNAPAWPLTKATKRETALWRREWKRPQAIEWERNGQEVEVALYVRSLAAAEHQGAPVNARTLVKQQQEALGISLPGLARNRWRIGTASPAVAAGPQRALPPSTRRLALVSGGGAGD